MWGVLNLIEPGFRQELEKQNGRHKSTFPRMQLFGKKNRGIRSPVNPISGGSVILPLPTHNTVKSERIEILPLGFFQATRQSRPFFVGRLKSDRSRF